MKLISNTCVGFCFLINTIAPNGQELAKLKLLTSKVPIKNKLKSNFNLRQFIVRRM